MAEELDMKLAQGTRRPQLPRSAPADMTTTMSMNIIMTMTMNRAAFVRAATMRFPAAWGMTGRWGGFSSRCWAAS